MPGILKGIRVLDFTRVVAGPFATRMLADFGAEVIKIQSSRTAGGFESNTAPYFCTWNRNKRSITLDMGHPEARELFLQLTAISDVVVENFSPGVMKRFTLDYDELKKIKSDIIMISFPGVGQEGPLSDVVTYGPSLAGLAGLDSLIGYEGERVLGMQQAYADINAALFGAFAIQMGLFHRERYGEGQHIEVAQIEALLCTMPEPIMEASLNNRILGTLGNVHPLMAVHNNYPCRGDDKWVSIAILTEAEWKGICKALGDPPWTQAEDFADSDKTRPPSRGSGCW